MEVHEFDVAVDPKFGLGALLTLRAIDFAHLDDPNDPFQESAEAAEASSGEESVDPFDPDNLSVPVVEDVRRRLQVDKLQPRGACEKAGIMVGDVFLRIRVATAGGDSDDDAAAWSIVANHTQLKSAYQKQKLVRIAVARDSEFAAAQAAATVAAVAAAAASPKAGSRRSGGFGSPQKSSGLAHPLMMSQVESEAERRTKELLDSGVITQEEYDSIIAKTQQRRAESQRALARAEAIRQGNVIVEAKFGKGSPLGITLYAKGSRYVRREKCLRCTMPHSPPPSLRGYSV